jgi:hypothetical protein
LEIELIAALIIEQGWEWTLFSGLSLLYGVVILAAVIFLLIKSARMEDGGDSKEQRFPGRVTGERPSERNPG